MSETSQPRILQGCKNHPPLQAKVVCRSCNAPLCSLCSKFVDGRFLCEECIAANVARKVALAGGAGGVSGTLRTGMSPRVPLNAIPTEAYANAPVSIEVPEPMPAEGTPTGAPGIPLEPTGPAIAGMMGSVRYDRRVAGTPGLLYSCKNHPGVRAELKCDLCGGVFCPDCVKETRKRLLCRDCARPGGRTALIARKAEPERPPTFAGRLPGAFFDPLLYERKYLLLAGPPALWLGFLAHWAAGWCIAAAIVLWLFKIARRTAQRAEDKSTHPMLEYAVDDIVKPFFLALLALLVLLLPVLFYVALFKWELVRYAAEYSGLAASNAKDPERLFTVLSTRALNDRFIPWALLAGATLLPLALGMLALYQRAEVLSPPNLLSALSSVGGYYLLMLLLLAAAFVPTWYVVMILDDFSGALGLGCAFLIVYFSMVAFRMFGDVYLTNKVLFQWYGRPLADC